MSPLPLALIGGLLSAGTNLTGSILGYKSNNKNIKFQQEQNALNRQMENERYWLQRRHALKDWATENAYNSPVEQMNRLRQAGLNPNLVYGKGADATAGSIRSSGFDKISAEAPHNDPSWIRGISEMGGNISDSFQRIYDLKAKQAQIDNVNQNTALQQQEQIFKQAGTAKTLQDTARSKFDLQQANELKDSVIQQAKLNNEKTRADITYTLDQNQRQALANTKNVQLTAEKIITEKIAHSKDQAQIDVLKAQLDNIRQSTQIQSYESQLTEMGIYKADPWYFRALMNLVNGNLKDPTGKISIPDDSTLNRRLDREFGNMFKPNPNYWK